MKVRSKGPADATIVVITDTPTRTAWQEGKIMGRREMEVLSRNLEVQGVTPREVRFITPSSPLPQEALGIEKKVGEWLALHRDDFLQKLQTSNPRLLIYLGKEAGRQLMGRPVKINSARGTLTTDKVTGTLVLPLLSPRHVLRRPEVRDIFDTDIRTVGTLKAGGWDARVFRSEDREARYRWVTNLEFLLDDLPGRLSFDVETVGLHWYRKQRLLTTQFCWREGESIVVPMDAAYIEGWRRSYHEALDNLDTDAEDYPAQKALLEEQIEEMPKEVVTPKVVTRIFKQVKALLGSQEVRVVGHNLKFDVHAIRNHGVKVANWYADTMQLAFAADDNMESKGLDDCVRRWIPAMSGYADAFNRSTDKSRMDLVPPHKMRAYACGDTDAVFRLAGVLVKEVRKDRANWNCFKRVQMPGLRAYVEIERVGFHLDRGKLLDLGKTLTVTQEALYKEMLALVPAEVRRAELEDPRHKGKEVRDILSFTRPDFIRRCLFSPEGLALEPVVFTKTTRNETGEGRLPSTSAKDHLGHFVGEPLVEKIIEFGSLSTMRGRYVGDPTQEDRKIITPLKSGKWPSPVIDTLTLAGKPIPTARTKDRVRRRIKVKVIRSRGEDQWRVPFKGGSDLSLDYLGRLVRIDKTEATGFWQYLGSDGADDIHPSYFLHSTVTGRTSCLRGDTPIPTKRGLVRIDSVSPGDLVWTHRQRWMPVVRGFVKPVSEMWKVTFSNGEVLRMTEWHRLLTHEGRWVTLRHVSIKETFGRRELAEECGNPLSRILANHGAGSGGGGGIPSHGVPYFEGHSTTGGAYAAKGTQILCEQGGCQEPTKGKEGGKLQGAGARWEGVSYGGSRWETVFLASRRDVRGAGDSPIGAACNSGRSPHRRGQDQQQRGQSCAGDACGACGDSSTLRQGGCGVTITGIEPCGSYPVYDIEVAEDHSYEAAGCFSHNSRDPNGQNLPKHGALAPAFRRIFKPSPGYLFLEADLSQIELRLAAWVSGDPTMIHAYQTGKDLHALTAASTMGVPFEEFSRWKGSSDRSPVRGFDTLGDYYSHQRFLAKGVNFGFVYGMWHTTFREYAKATFKVDISPRDAERYRNVFFETYPRLETYHRKMKEFVRGHGYVRALHGALRRLPSIDSDDEGVQKETERQSINSSIQRFGSDLLVMSASRLVRDAPAELIRPCGTIHDSMILEVREDYVEEGASAAKFYMESNPLKAWFGITPPIPLLADVSGPSTDLAEMREMRVTAVAPSWYQPQHDR